ncbi:hypothetical protein BDR26DRAFT_869022 [Obelidium mucronatum]|nr:hypothetical protein BDR26DRAFT_869022 [Obelidium mucronatum]
MLLQLQAVMEKEDALSRKRAALTTKTTEKIKKFVKDGVAADAGAAGGYFNKDLDASEGTTESAPKECPLKGKCPYVSDHHVEHTGEGCPLKKGACPYYTEHAKDKDIADLLQHEGGCPLKTKCPYYKALKNGEKVDLSGTKCPLAEKCPYYKEVKDHGAADCPLEKYFKKDFEKGGHAHHGGKHDSHQAKDCPYIKNHKTKGETHDEL